MKLLDTKAYNIYTKKRSVSFYGIYSIGVYNA